MVEALKVRLQRLNFYCLGSRKSLKGFKLENGMMKSVLRILVFMVVCRIY